MNDYARLREALGLSAPEADASMEELDEYLGRLMVTEDSEGELIPLGLEPARILGLWRFPLGFETFREQWGFALGDVEQDLSLFTKEPIEVLRGRFDQRSIDDALRSDATYGDFVREATHSQVAYYTWPERDPLDFLDLPVRWGHGLATQGDFLYWAPSGQIERMIDIGLGNERSLADIERYRLLAEGLGRFDVYAASVTDVTVPVSVAAILMTGVGATAEQLETMEAELRQQTLLLPYEGTATGVGADDRGFYTVVVVVHPDEQTAKKNGTRLEARIDEGATNRFGVRWNAVISELDVVTEGRVLIARMYSDDTKLWYNLVVRKEPLLLFDDSAQP